MTEPRTRTTRASGSRPPLDARRLAKFQSLGLFADPDDRLSFTRAASAKQCRGAYALVYDIYTRAGYIGERRSGMRIRPFEADPATATFIAHSGRDVVGVFSVIPDSTDIGLPSDHAFSWELDSIRAEGRLVCELSNLAVEERFRSSPITTELMRLAYAHAHYIGCTDLVCAVSPIPSLMMAFSYIGFEQVGAARSSSDEVNDPVVLMWLPRIQERWERSSPTGEFADTFWRQFFVHDNRYRRRIEDWMEATATMFEDPLEMLTLFGKEAELFGRADDQLLGALAERLGESFEPCYRASTMLPGAPYSVGSRSSDSIEPPPAD